VHGAEKLAAGSYTRQFRARRLKGTDLRWFASQAAADAYARFQRTCYGASQAAHA
jgi:hypothetical protein